MNSESNDFQQLRRLLALKRYELPPPRYFNDFSDKVMARLAAPEQPSLSWWQRLGLDFDFRPAVMCGVGIVVCGLLSFGVISAMQMAEPNSIALQAQSLPSPMDTPAMAGITPLAAPVDAAASIAPLISKQSSSPFNQFAFGATKVGFSSLGFSGN